MRSWNRAAGRAAVALAALTLSGCGPKMPYTPPKPEKHASDLSGILQPATVDALNARLEAYEALTHHQVVVMLLPSSHGRKPDELALDALNRWGIGRSAHHSVSAVVAGEKIPFDDGVVVLVFTDDPRSIGIATGHRMRSGPLPDVECARIYHDVMKPLMLPHPAAALNAGVDAIFQAIDTFEGRS